MLRFRVYMQMSVCEVDHELNERLCFALCERIQDSLGFWIPGTGFQALDSSLCQWDLDSEFQYLVGFRVLELYSGFHKQIFPGFWNPNSLTCILQSRRIL